MAKPSAARVERLAAELFRHRLATGRTPESVAGQCIDLATIFYAVWDDRAAKRPAKGEPDGPPAEDPAAE